jgi:hypothetical protein
MVDMQTFDERHLKKVGSRQKAIGKGKNKSSAVDKGKRQKLR